MTVVSITKTVTFSLPSGVNVTIPNLADADIEWLSLRVGRAPFSQASLDVFDERQRQIEVEGWTPDHDDRVQGRATLARAAHCYVSAAAGLLIGGTLAEREPPLWPWAAEWWKPDTPRRMLVKAAALILAQIEKIDREAAR